ncbi:MAG TPA: hypothetical protein VGC13_04260 [Longimicrobium sp.]|jgi:hypothetical protein|uniref:hypothetical protein n=1 Tax=Longimicrobium sp. TaxID=2029185 RepID=UPI002ED8C5FF
MPLLKPHHYELLQRIIAAGELPPGEVDGRLLRPLRTSGLVRVDEDRIRVTVAGRDAVSMPGADTAAPRETGKLSSAQEDLLRLIVRAGGLNREDVDLRTARALRSRGLVGEDGGMLTGTPAGVAHLEALDWRETPRRRGRRPHRHPRAEAILKATQQLEHALPPEAEVLVGPIMCAAEDVSAGFRTFARQLITDTKPRGKK